MDDNSKLAETKLCNKCKKNLPLSEFWKHPKRKDGLQSTCKQCMYARRRELKTPESMELARASLRRWRENNKERNTAIAFKHNLKKWFKMTWEDYEQMLRNQGGVCAICKQPPTTQLLSVDHDHACCPERTTCGMCVRKLLCGNCNRAIGIMQDDPERLEEAAKYLRENVLLNG